MSIVEKMARAIYECRNGHGCMPWSIRNKAHKEPYLSDARAALTATGLTEAQLEGLANGTHVVVPVEPTEAMCQNAALQVLFTDWCELAEDDKVGLLHVYRAMLAAKEG